MKKGVSSMMQHTAGSALNEGKLRDHCHFTGKCRRAAYYKCNLQFKKLKLIPVIINKLTGYDSHLFIKNLSNPLGLGKARETSNAFPRTKKSTSALVKKLLLAHTSTKKIKKLKSRLSFALSTASGACLHSLKN